jgi:hypothetical protein
MSFRYFVWCALLLLPVAATAQTVKLTGLGAGTCKEFNQDVARNWQIQRDYFAWAQGYMSCLLMRAPAGIEDATDLNPPTYPLIKQVEFLRDFCAHNVVGYYADGVESLYRSLVKKN